MEIIISRFYNKYLDVIDKGKKAEDKCFSSDWYRYEIELKFDVTSGTSFLKHHKSRQKILKYFMRSKFDNFRLVSYRVMMFHLLEILLK